MSIISTILGVETSGGHNIPQGNIGDTNNLHGTPAQGYFQIIDPTWARYGGLSTGFTSAIQAPYATQLQIAQNIPIGQWGSATQNALRANGYSFSGSETLGQVLSRYGEDPTATVPADGASTGGTAVAGAGAIPGEASQYGYGIGATEAGPTSLAGAPPGALTNSGTLSGDITGYTVAGVNSPFTSDLTGAAASSSAQTGPAVTSVPQAISNQTATQAKSASAANQQAQTDTQAQTSTDLGIFGAAAQDISQLFVRGGVVILGIIFVGAALFMLAPRQAKEALA